MQMNRTAGAYHGTARGITETAPTNYILSFTFKYYLNLIFLIKKN